MSHIDRKLRQKEAIKKSILIAAMHIAADEGWDNVTIRKIAEEIEYTPPIVYEHFENKEDLINEIIQTGYELLNKEVNKVLKSELEPIKALKKLSFIFWDFANKNKQLYSLMFRLEQSNPGAGRGLFIKIYNDLFKSLSSENINLANELYQSWISSLHGCIILLVLFPIPQELSKESPKRLFEKVIDRFINSI